MKMISPATKYTLGRIALFVVVVLVLLPIKMDMLVRLMIALVVSMVASWFLLARWRNEMAGTIERSMAKRNVEKEKLRAALAGDDEQVGPGADK